jgi:DNA-binding cell septation regulator SpoVG
MKIENWRPNTFGGKKLGTFSLELPSGMTLVDCSVVNGDKGHFIGLPQKSYEKDGQTKYVALVKFWDREKQTRFDEMVLAALREAGCL